MAPDKSFNKFDLLAQLRGDVSNSNTLFVKFNKYGYAYGLARCPSALNKALHGKQTGTDRTTQHCFSQSATGGPSCSCNMPLLLIWLEMGVEVLF